MTKILFSNIGYARGIDGTLWQHICRVSRHIYSRRGPQKAVLEQIRQIILKEDPELCCFVEVDQGSLQSAYLNQLQALTNERYVFFNAANKYGDTTHLHRMPFHTGKSNGFMAKSDCTFTRLYLQHGSKRLVYKIDLPDQMTLFFAHFSLRANVRQLQFAELNSWVKECAGPVMILADFNIMQGFGELKPLLEGTDLTVINDEQHHTFSFHRQRLALDLCICSEGLAERVKLKIIDQPFSDHDALLVEL
jgi:endonuclease/exonuclease/phosphatase family metal-dependent hydrolase